MPLVKKLGGRKIKRTKAIRGKRIVVWFADGTKEVVSEDVYKGEVDVSHSNDSPQFNDSLIRPVRAIERDHTYQPNAELPTFGWVLLAATVVVAIVVAALLRP